MKTSEEPLKVAGIHLAGAHSSKTSVVILSGSYKKLNLSMQQVYKGVGSTKQMSSDDRILSILQAEKPQQIFFDCPLSLPPCITCTLVTCPGKQNCSEISVNYMQLIYLKYLDSSSYKKSNKKFFNPQYYRLWDIWWGFFSDQSTVPSFGSNMSTIASRAHVLQKRMKADAQIVGPKETSPRVIIELLKGRKNLEDLGSLQYSKEARERVVMYLLKSAPIGIETSLEVVFLITSSFAKFSAFVTAIVALHYSFGQVFYAPEEYLDEGGWVYLPKILEPELRSLLVKKPNIFDKDVINSA